MQQKTYSPYIDLYNRSTKEETGWHLDQQADQKAALRIVTCV